MGNLLGRGSVVNALDLHQAGARVGDMARALVAQVATPNHSRQFKSILYRANAADLSERSFAGFSSATRSESRSGKIVSSKA